MNVQRAAFADGRQHFQHGPIDLVIGAEGEPAALAQAHEAAWARFATLLPALVSELAVLRQPVQPGAGNPLQGPVARCMWAACEPLAGVYLTPMAAVAGAVADAVLAVYRAPGITRAWVNNGGDIALHLTPGTEAAVGLFGDLGRFDPASADGRRLDGRFTVAAGMPVRGIATSGWRGRSFSLGIADSVTVLAATAAQADAAATIVANAVDAAHAGIVRAPASSVKDDSDLGGLLVTRDVPALPRDVVHAALARGLVRAEALHGQGLLHAAVLVCQGQYAATRSFAGHALPHNGPAVAAALPQTGMPAGGAEQVGSVFA